MIRVVSSDHGPQTLKRNVGLLFRLPLSSLTTNDVSAVSRMCLSFETVTGNDDHPLLEPANPCDATIRNEFPESDAPLEITMLQFDAELERTHN